MKTFIYFSQGEWRTFQAEELPVKPNQWDYEAGGDYPYQAPYVSPNYYDALEQYESEIAALKAKAIPVGNSEILKKVSLAEARIVETSVPILEWPGTVEVKEESGTCTRDVCYEEQCMNGDCGRNKLAILKLSETS